MTAPLSEFKFQGPQWIPVWVQTVLRGVQMKFLKAHSLEGQTWIITKNVEEKKGGEIVGKGEKERRITLFRSYST